MVFMNKEIYTIIGVGVALTAIMLSSQAALRADMRTELAGLRAEHADMRADMRSEHAELRSQISGLRSDMREDFAAVRTEMGDLRSEMGDLRTGMGDVRERVIRIEVGQGASSPGQEVLEP